MYLLSTDATEMYVTQAVGAVTCWRCGTDTARAGMEPGVLLPEGPNEDAGVRLLLVQWGSSLWRNKSVINKRSLQNNSSLQNKRSLVESNYRIRLGNGPIMWHVRRGSGRQAGQPGF